MDQVRTRMLEAIELHLSSMRLDGDPIPGPSSFADMLEVA